MTPFQIFDIERHVAAKKSLAKDPVIADLIRIVHEQDDEIFELKREVENLEGERSDLDCDVGNLMEALEAIRTAPPGIVCDGKPECECAKCIATRAVEGEKRAQGP